MDDLNNGGGSDDASASGNSGGGGVSAAAPRLPLGGAVGGGGLHYTIPGILHFLQHEWSRFEMERSQWEVDKAELQSRIAFLQGERKGQENLKNDLVRRIKMLEYALKQERVKYNKLKYGTDSLNALDATKAPPAAGGAHNADSDGESGLLQPNIDGDNYIAVSKGDYRQGRQLLRQYLQEIGYTDTIIDVRSNRVRSLLGLADASSASTGDANDVNEENRTNLAMNGGGGESANTATTRRADGGGGGGSQGTGAKRSSAAKTISEEMMLDTEAAVMANFDFLSSEAEVDDDDDGQDADDDGYNPADIKAKSIKLAQTVSDSVAAAAAASDKDTEEVLNEFNFLANPDGVDGSGGGGGGGGAKTGSGGGGGPAAKASKDESGNVDYLGHYSSPTPSSGAGRQAGPATAVAATPPAVTAGAKGAAADKAEELGTNLELGELEQLTITNDNESSYDITAPKEAFRKTWSAKYTLRSHFDGVRALAFHPSEPVLLTASEDQTLKLWNLQKTIPAKKSASLDVEPVYTFRAHRGPVLSLAVAPQGDLVFSGGLDSTVRCWKMPGVNVDPYDAYDPDVLLETFTGHEDAVWGLAYHGPRRRLLSCSADGSVKLWAAPAATKESSASSASQQSPLARTYMAGALLGVPTSVDWIHEDPERMVTAYASGACKIYNVETGQTVVALDTSASQTNAITKVVSHPTLPLTITAHEDRHIRFFDNNTGKLTHEMVAHLDAVTSLAIDANGLYLISGSHDCSVRLWNLETRTCVQEITAHRKKFDESIFDVAFHPSKPYIASAGADAQAKVFV